MKFSNALYLSSALLMLVGCVSVTDTSLSDEMNGLDGSGGDNSDPDTGSTGGAPLTGNTGGAPVTGNTGGGTATATGGETATGGGDAATGGAMATGGGSSTGGGGGGSATCPAATCGGTNPLSSDSCYTVTIGQYGGWQLDSDAGCTLTVDGVDGVAGQELTPDTPHEIEVTGCTLPYANLGCWI